MNNTNGAANFLAIFGLKQDDSLFPRTKNVMKIKQTLSLLTLGLVTLSMVGRAQTTPTGAATSTTYPTGAVVSDSAGSTKPSRNQRRATKRSRANQNSQRNAGNAGQEGQYRQSSAANGTTVNNSNSTNYNSNNATNNPTGVGSNPSSSATPTSPGGSSPSTGSATTSGSNSGSNNASSTGGAPKTGTAAAVTGARTTATPAVVAGSTERNTSIHDFIASSPNYTTLQNALQSADLNELFKGNGPYTLFAPSNNAFKKLPATVQAGLLEGRNRDALKQLLSYHVVQGSVDAAELAQRIRAGNGKAQLQTVAGGTLTVQPGSGGRLTVTDEQGKSAVVEAPDKLQSNGIVHGVDAVLLPKNGANGIR